MRRGGTGEEERRLGAAGGRGDQAAAELGSGRRAPPLRRPRLRPPPLRRLPLRPPRCTTPATNLKTRADLDLDLRVDFCPNPSIFSVFHRIIYLHPWLRFGRVACQIVRLDEYFISFHCTMCI